MEKQRQKEICKQKLGHIVQLVHVVGEAEIGTNVLQRVDPLQVVVEQAYSQRLTILGMAGMPCGASGCTKTATYRIDYTCPDCGYTSVHRLCDKDFAVQSYICTQTVTKPIICTTCNGRGYYYTYSNCTHGYSYGSSHYYCNKTGHGSYRGSSNLHD